MGLFFGTSLVFGIAAACIVPYFYAYCTQSSEVSVHDEVTEEEKKSETIKDVEYSLRVEEQGNNSLQKKTKDASTNTLESMSSDSTLYKKLPCIEENSLEEQEERFTTTSTQTNDSASSLATIHAPMAVQALFHAENYNSKTEIVIDESKNSQTSIKNANQIDLVLTKKPFFKKEKHTERLKKFWMNLKSGAKFPKSSSSEESKNLNDALSEIPSKSSTRKGTESSTNMNSGERNLSSFEKKPPFVHSTLRDSKQKLSLKYHEVNGSPSIHIESPSGSSTTISAVDLTSPSDLTVPQSQGFLVIFKEKNCSSDFSTNLDENFTLHKLYKSLPSRLRPGEAYVTHSVKRSSSIS